MQRQDLFNEFCDVVFTLLPSPEQVHDEVSREDVEAFRQKFRAVFERVEMQVIADAEFTAEDEADMVLGQEREEIGRD
jgi:hypothetical protein